MADYVFVLSSGEEIPVVITTKRGMRNITLRPKSTPKREIHISKPWLTTNATAINFLKSKQKWVDSIYQKCPEKIKLKSGASIEIFGQNVLLLHNSGQRGNTWQDATDGHGAVLTVGGGADMFERRVRDFIKSEFLKYVKGVIRTTPSEFWPLRIAVRDTVSRWGSCSSTGTMSFSWRLAFAPTDVSRYVIMHELAHTKHMDHSPEFWATVRDLYGFGVERAKRWLVKNGGNLYQYL